MLIIVFPANAEIKVWSESSSKKVFRDTFPSSNITEGMQLYAAKNEYTAGQIAIRSDITLNKVTVKVSKLVDRKTQTTIPSSKIKLYLVHYVYLSAPHSSENKKKLTTENAKEYPDALLPMRAFSLLADKSQAIWVAIMVDKKQHCGVYQGTATILSNNRKLAEIKIKLTVWRFSLPDTPSMRSVISGAMSSEGLKGEVGKKMKVFIIILLFIIAPSAFKA